VTIAPPRRFDGRILDRADRPSANAMVWARPAEQLWSSVQILADQEGQFEGNGWQQRILLYSRSADGQKAAFGEIPVAAASADLLLRPAARIVGTVRHRDGTPAAHTTLRAIIWHQSSQIQSGGHIADVMTLTDKEGRYVLKGLPVGAKVDLLANPD